MYLSDMRNVFVEMQEKLVAAKSLTKLNLKAQNKKTYHLKSGIKLLTEQRKLLFIKV